MRNPVLLRVVALVVVALGLALLLPGGPTALADDVPLTVSGSHLSSIDPASEDWTSKAADWYAARLTTEQVRVCREAGTERPFTGGLLDYKGKDTFVCSSCGLPLFEGETKFKSGTGWPSFHTAVPENVKQIKDTSLGMLRVEVRCNRCDAHLGHVFDDGPPPTGKRFCINSVCLLRDDGAPPAAAP
jgi:peptide-methionine (R)-S-oxide reductase